MHFFLLQTRIEENIKAAIDSLQQEVRSIRVEIRPQFLVPDTNCFIDYLHGITMLLAGKRFTVIVPLIGMFAALLFLTGAYKFVKLLHVFMVSIFYVGCQLDFILKSLRLRSLSFTFFFCNFCMIL